MKKNLLSLAELRNSVVGKSVFSPTDADEVMGHELMVSNKILLSGKPILI